jgi:hypothetical protein
LAIRDSRRPDFSTRRRTGAAGEGEKAEFAPSSDAGAVVVRQHDTPAFVSMSQPGRNAVALPAAGMSVRLRTRYTNPSTRSITGTRESALAATDDSAFVEASGDFSRRGMVRRISSSIRRCSSELAACAR